MEEGSTLTANIAVELSRSLDSDKVMQRLHNNDEFDFSHEEGVFDVNDDDDDDDDEDNNIDSNYQSQSILHLNNQHRQGLSLKDLSNSPESISITPEDFDQIVKLKSDFDALSSEFDMVQGEARQFKDKNMELVTENGGLKKKLASHIMEISDLTRERNFLTQSLSLKSEEMEQELKLREAEKDTQDGLYSNQKDKLREMSQLIMKRKIARLEAEAKQMHKKLEEAEKVIADQENQVDDLEEAIRALPPSSTALSGVYGHAHVLSSASAMEKTVLKVLALPDSDLSGNTVDDEDLTEKCGRQHLIVQVKHCRRVIGMLQSWQQETRKRLRRKALLFFVVFVLLSLAMAILDPAR